VGMIWIDRRRVKDLSPTAFTLECNRLWLVMTEKHWRSKEDLPAYWLARYLVLEEEHRRRGTQLRLFEDYGSDRA
jgi:hypothetical protein